MREERSKTNAGRHYTGRPAGEDSHRGASRTRKKAPVGVLLFAGIVLLIGALFLCLYLIRIDRVTVSGNAFVSPEVILEKAFPEEEDYHLYRVLLKLVKGYPENEFAESMRLKLHGLSEAEIVVSEKPAVAEINAGGTYLFLNRDGIVLGHAGEKREGLPYITGVRVLAFRDFEFPETDEKETLLGAITVAEKARELKLSEECVRVENGQYFLEFGDVTAAIGSLSFLEGKLQEIRDQKSVYEGLKGTVHLETYDGSEGQRFYFETAE